MNYKCTISYKGTNYYGWARQNQLPTIERILLDTFEELFGYEVALFGSGRTDRYVHALAQVFSVKHDELTIEPDQLMHALNSKLPKDIRITSCETAPDNFHARFHATAKTYIYKLSTHPNYNLFTDELVYQYNHELDYAKFEDFKALIIGKHNFLSFSTSEIQDTVREVTRFEIQKQPGDITNFVITGTGFLRNMVRMIVGTFLNYNEGRITLEDVQKYLDEPKKGQAIRKVNGCGLYLYNVEY